MDWSWNWILFAILLIVCTLYTQFSRGAMNDANVARYGPRADYRADPVGAIVGSVLAGAVLASAITALFGFL